MPWAHDDWRRSLLRLGMVVLLFFILVEWIRPILSITDTATIRIFLYWILGVLLLEWLLLPLVLRYILALLYLAMLIYQNYYTQVPFWHGDWLKDFWGDWKNSYLALQAGEILEMAPEIRTLLFLIGIGLGTQLIAWLILKKQRGLSFFIATIIYLTLLDTWSAYQANTAIVRTFLLSFLLLSLIRWSQLWKEAGEESKSVFPLIHWVLASVLLLTIVILPALFAPKFAPQWPDPVAWIKSLREESGTLSGVGIKKVGYGEDDTRLGGPFLQDATPIFRAYSTRPFYWRGDVKEIYTGRGWKAREGYYQLLLVPTLELPTPAILKEEKLEERINALLHPALSPVVSDNTYWRQVQFQSVTFYEPKYRTMFYGGSLLNVYESEDGEIGDKLRLDITRQSVHSMSGLLEEYTILTAVPQILDKEIRTVELARSQEVGIEYLQLPDQLPERVRELAKEITAGKTTQYEKVRAIESYFRTGPFQYETAQVEDVPPGHDFVDFFLFDSPQGYCDHFSTSMVVLLRANEIPARWVKGFTPGLTTSTQQEGYTQIVRARDAHSWVEVYFDGIGWLPFEPTKGFANPITVVYDQDWTSTQTEIMPILLQNRDLQDRLIEEEVAQETGTSPVKESSQWWKGWNLFFLVLLIVLLIILFRFRQRLLWWLRIQRVGHLAHGKAWNVAVEYLLRALSIRYGKRQDGETLREYVQGIRTTRELQAQLQDFIQNYEEQRYGKTNADSWSQERYHQWKEIVHRLTA